VNTVVNVVKKDLLVCNTKAPRAELITGTWVLYFLTLFLREIYVNRKEFVIAFDTIWHINRLVFRYFDRRCRI
jgi:hypothetical protein